MNLTQIGKHAFRNAMEKGFHDHPTPPSREWVIASMALLHSEVSEAVEEIRNPNQPLTEDRLRSDGKPEGLPSELADVIIRACDIAETLGIDLDAAVKRKMAFNLTRPSRHGGKAL